VEYPDGVTHYFAHDEGANLVRTQDARGWTYFTYDTSSHLTQELAPDGAETAHVYDAVGRRSAVTSPGGSVHYAYDAVGRMQHASSSNATLGTAYYTYDEAGSVIKKVLGNGCYTYFAYDALNRPTEVLNCLPNGSPLAYFEYTYDPAGRITKCTREDGNVVYYGYDNAEQLASETWRHSGGGTIYAFEWDYDLAGNRTYQRRDSVETYYTYDAGNQLTQYHELPADTWTYFTYDSRGNCADIEEPDGTTYFEYNDANLVANIRFKDGTPNYFHYDAQLRRYAMEDSAGLSYFTWDTNGMSLLAERDLTGATTAEYVHGHTPIPGIGSLVAASKEGGGTTYYQYPVYDHRGSVTCLADQSGNVTAYYEYNAWGETLRNETVQPATDNRFQYQSNWLALKDGGGDFYLSPARLYHVVTGRFMQEDQLPKTMSRQKLGVFENSLFVAEQRRALQLGKLLHLSVPSSAAGYSHESDATHETHGNRPSDQLHTELKNFGIRLLARSSWALGANRHAYVSHNAASLVDPTGEGWFDIVVGVLPIVGTLLNSLSEQPGSKFYWYASAGVTPDECCVLGSLGAWIECKKRMKALGAAYAGKSQLLVLGHGALDAALALALGVTGIGLLFLFDAFADLVLTAMDLSDIDDAQRAATVVYCNCKRL